jgi:hypothetical protein
MVVISLIKKVKEPIEPAAIGEIQSPASHFAHRPSDLPIPRKPGYNPPPQVDSLHLRMPKLMIPAIPKVPWPIVTA